MSTAQPDLDGSSIALAIVVARFNEHITSRLLEGARDAIVRHSVASHDVFHVPGSFELPVAALYAADSDNYDAIVCLGAVIRHETDHYQHIATQAASGIQQVALETGVPCHFGVLTCDNEEQALARSGSDRNVGRDAVEAAIQTIVTLRSINPD
ncbi:MAG: 6,7-dimethyl-8-ribityllumazine synthase [Dehalococcoidia bacterium]